MRPGFFMPAPFFIVGPTAAGKSGLAVEVAARCGAEIIGADALQVYAGFDLLTAKPSWEQRQRVPHHMIGTIVPTANYSAARYLEDAQRSLRSVDGRGKPAIVVGGTGLYIKALTHGLSPLPEAHPALRAELEALDAPTLLARLRVLDPQAADNIDRHNKRRLVRAVEVCLLTGTPFSEHQTLWGQTPEDQKPNGAFLVRSKVEMDARITRRVTAMFDHGVIEEVRASQSLTLSLTASRMIGLRDIQELLAGHQKLAQCRERIRLATRQYAKRQVTWFQREKSFEQLDLSTLPDEETQIAWLFERYAAFARSA